MPEITRKDFLKLLAAAGGAAALAGFMPGKWVKPIVKVGVLPVHAQSSGLTITGFSVYYSMGKSLKGSGLASRVKTTTSSGGSCNYEDSASEFDENALIHLTASLDNSSSVLIAWERLGDIGSISGSVQSGILYFHFTLDPAYNNPNTEFTLVVKMNGRVSNPLIGYLVPD